MKRIALFILAGLITISVSARKRLATYQKQVIECLGVEGDGSQTLRVTGTGRNKTDAKEQAKKDAVAAVIFNGIRSGMGGCDTRPLISEHNARDKYAEYFNIFFMDGGEYKKYVSMEDRKRRSDNKSKNKLFKNYRLTIRVHRNELESRLKEDGVIKNK